MLSYCTYFGYGFDRCIKVERLYAKSLAIFGYFCYNHTNYGNIGEVPIWRYKHRDKVRKYRWQEQTRARFVIFV